MALAKFAVLITSKRVNLSLFSEYGCVIPDARDLQDRDVPGALLRFSIVLLIHFES